MACISTNQLYRERVNLYFSLVVDSSGSLNAHALVHLRLDLVNHFDGGDFFREISCLVQCAQIRLIAKDQNELSFAGVPRTSNLLATLQVKSGDSGSLQNMVSNEPVLQISH